MTRTIRVLTDEEAERLASLGEVRGFDMAQSARRMKLTPEERVAYAAEQYRIHESLRGLARRARQ